MTLAQSLQAVPDSSQPWVSAEAEEELTAATPPWSPGQWEDWAGGKTESLGRVTVWEQHRPRASVPRGQETLPSPAPWVPSPRHGERLAGERVRGGEGSGRISVSSAGTGGAATTQASPGPAQAPAASVPAGFTLLRVTEGPTETVPRVLPTNDCPVRN